ncbi:MAG: polysaccharide lyase 8 family protein, partial [Clostridiales bacterium]|nr:polysaccharide lyase 8 family protein [Clostridiales bacterium]
MDYSYLRKRWADYLTGNNKDVESPDTQEVIKSMERVADIDFSVEEKSAHNIVYTTPYYTLNALAKSYRTIGTKHFEDPGTLKRILDGLERMHDTDYNMDTPHGNWWALEVGNPKNLLDVCILLRDEIGAEAIKKYTDVVLHFKDEYVRETQGGRTETGANLAWKCRVMFLAGIVREDPELIDWANEHLQEVMRYSNNAITYPGMVTFYDDGFYSDGTFIQHYFFHYTGGYGKNLMTTLGGLFYAFWDTGAITVPEENLRFMHRMVFDAYEPLIYKGRFLDIARGREVSRFFHQDHITARHVMRGICYLSETMNPKDKLRARSMIKEWLSYDGAYDLLRDEDARAEHYVYGSILPIYREIMATEPRGDLFLNKTFGVGADAVHHQKDYCFAVKMHSQSIASYEYLNEESKKLWHISDGVTYIYGADLDCFNGGYYATVDTQRLPGTTVDRSPRRAEDPYFSWFLPDSKNPCAFAGGVDLGPCGAAGMQFLGQGLGLTRDLEAKKSWFMFDREVLCLGSGITSPSGDPVETIVDNRRRSTPAFVGESAAHATGVKGKGIGYWFPGKADVKILAERRVGTWNSVEVDPDYCTENDFATIWIEHGRKPTNADYAYVVLPEFSAAEVLEYSRNPGVEVIENSAKVHAARHARLSATAANFWEASEVSGIKASAPCSAIYQQSENVLNIAVSDPARSESVIEISFPFNASKVLKRDSR